MTTSLYVWRVPRTGIPAALWRMAADRGRLRAAPGVSFAKLLGTARGSRFGPGQADLTRWAALVVHDGTGPTGWSPRALAGCRLDLRPLASRGAWAGRNPFPVDPDPDRGSPAAGHPVRAGRAGGTVAGNSITPVLALTRARLRPSRAIGFWRATSPVAAALADAPGLLAAFGIGEAPLGWQGTVSLWRTPTDLVRFAYRHPEHRRAIERTTSIGWYAEQLFARFDVLDVVGDTEVIGWVGERRVPT